MRKRTALAFAVVALLTVLSLGHVSAAEKDHPQQITVNGKNYNSNPSCDSPRSWSLQAFPHTNWALARDIRRMQ